MVGVAVKVTEFPTHIVLADADIDTLADRFGLTIMVTVFDVAGLPVEQITFDVMTHVIWSPLARVELAYVR